MLFRLSVSFLVGVVFYSGFAQAQTQNQATQEAKAINLVRDINKRVISSDQDLNEFYMDIFVDYFPESIGDPYSSFFISESQNLSIVVVASSQDGFRSFAGGVSFVDGQYQEIICGTSVPSQEINPPELNNNQLTCGEGSVEINP